MGYSLYVVLLRIISWRGLAELGPPGSWGFAWERQSVPGGTSSRESVTRDPESLMDILSGKL